MIEVKNKHTRVKQEDSEEDEIMHVHTAKKTERNKKFKRFIYSKQLDEKKHLKIVVLSDTHGKVDYGEIKCDIFLFAGDFTSNRETGPGKLANHSLDNFKELLGKIQSKLKIVVFGNHDYFEHLTVSEIQNQLLWRRAIYLQDSYHTVNIEKMFPSKKVNKLRKLKIYGSPYTQMDMAYNSVKLSPHFSKISDDTNIILSHVPPKNILDLAYDYTRKQRGTSKPCVFCKRKHYNKYHWGSVALKKRIERIHPKGNLLLSCFGHVHEDAGVLIDKKGMVYMNGSGKPLTYYIRL